MVAAVAWCWEVSRLIIYTSTDHAPTFRDFLTLFNRRVSLARVYHESVNAASEDHSYSSQTPQWQSSVANTALAKRSMWNMMRMLLLLVEM